MRIEHIGIAVKNEEEATALFASLLGREAYKTEAVASEGVNTVFFGLDNAKIELLTSLSDNSAVEKFLNRRGEGIHHIALAVDDIRAEVSRLKAEGFTFVNEEPRRGADGKWICFLHPKSTQGVLVELCQDMKK